MPRPVPRGSLPIYHNEYHAMPLHPQARIAIERAGVMPAKLSPSERRRWYDATRMALQPPRPPIPHWRPVEIATRAGRIAGRLYVPPAGTGADSPWSEK